MMLSLFLAALAPIQPFTANEAILQREATLRYRECITAQIDRLEPSGEPAEAVFAGAKQACDKQHDELFLVMSTLMYPRVVKPTAERLGDIVNYGVTKLEEQMLSESRLRILEIRAARKK